MVIANKVHSFDYPSACCLLFDDGDFGLLCTLVSEFGATSWKFNDKGSGIEDAEIMENLTAPVANYWQMYIGGTTVYFIESSKSSLLLWNNQAT